MERLNISGTRVRDDPHYRYTMPSLEIRHEGKGNGQKTVILNGKDVSDALDRPLEILVKYFGIELGCQSRLETERVILNGTYTSTQLQTVLNTFIDMYVLCPNCALPETDMTLKKEIVGHKCRSCGAKNMVPGDHKLNKYIVKLYGK